MDLFIDELTNDLFLSDGGEARLTRREEEETRQRLFITLSTIRGEWFANIGYGIPYLDYDGNGQGIKILAGKDLNILDFEVQNAISGTEGVNEITSYSSSWDRYSRKVTVNFTVETESGEIITIATEI